MSKTEIAQGLERLPQLERVEVIKSALANLCPGNGKTIDRFMRRLENPDIPEDVWRGIEQAEDGNLIDFDEALLGLDKP